MASNASVHHDSFPSRDAIMADLRAVLPVPDLMAWLIHTYPTLPTRRMLDMVMHVKRFGDLTVEVGGQREYETATHYVCGRVISIRRAVE